MTTTTTSIKRNTIKAQVVSDEIRPQVASLGAGARPMVRPPPPPPPVRLGAGAPPSVKRGRPMVGTFEENILNNRLEPIRTVDGYVADLRASCNSKQPKPLRSGVRVSFYSIDGCFPYLGQVNLGQRGYKIPKRGTLQVSLFNPNGTLVKLFLLHYDLADMPPNSQTFLRQKTLFLPIKSTASVGKPQDSTPSPIINHDLNNSEHQAPLIGRNILCDTNKTSKNSQPLPPPPAQAPPQQRAAAETEHHSTKSRIKYLIQLNIVSSKSGRIYLNKDLRIFISKKVDLETASQFSSQNYELKAFDEMPRNPKYFSR